MSTFNKTWVEGKTVKEIITTLRPSNTHKPHHDIEGIIFTDGSALYFDVGKTADQHSTIPKYLPPKKERAACIPDVTAKIYLVDHGYQVDFIDSKGKELGSQCRDFGGSYGIRKLINYSVAAIVNGMRKMEEVMISANRKGKAGPPPQ